MTSGIPSRLFARRLKAALALADLTIAELADKVPPQYRLSLSTLNRTTSGDRAPNEWEVPLFAELLDVPEWFLRDGIGRDVTDPAEADERVTAEIAGLRRDLMVKLDDVSRELREEIRKGRP